MKFRISATGFTLACALLLGSCSDPVGPRCPSGNAEDCWARVGLEGEIIQDIQATHWGLYATVGQHWGDPDTGGLFRLDEATGTWEYLAFRGHRVRNLMYIPDPEPRLYLGLDTGAPPLYVTEDGETWRPVPIVSEDGSRMLSAASLGSDPRDPNRIYVGGAMYTLYESRDAGETWRWMHMHPDYNASGWVYFAGRSPHGRIWYGGEASLGFEDLSGDLFYSDDDGANWTAPWPYTGPGPRPDAPPILVDIFHHPTDPNTTLVLAPGHILRTTDGGQSWREVPHNSLGFTHFFRWNDTLYVIGRDLLASSDFGRRWSRAVPFPVVTDRSTGEQYRWPTAATIDSAGRLYVATVDGVWWFEGIL